MRIFSPKVQKVRALNLLMTLKKDRHSKYQNMDIGKIKYKIMQICRHFQVIYLGFPENPGTISSRGEYFLLFPFIKGEKFVVLTDLVNRQGKVKPNMPILTGKSLPMKCQIFTPDFQVCIWDPYSYGRLTLLGSLH